jgi:hypothetical protein
VLALVVDPGIPVTIEQLVEDARLDLRIVAGPLLFAVGLVGSLEGLG